MKVHCNEHGGCFGFHLVAEDMKDAAFLVRFSQNATKEVRHASVCPGETGSFTGSIVLGKRRRDRSYLHVGKP